jgi:hypothetical protein
MKFRRIIQNRGRQLLTDSNRLSLARPELVAAWHPTKNKPLTPEDVSFGSHRTVWWIAMPIETMIECESLTKRFGQIGAVSFVLVDGKQ